MSIDKNRIIDILNNKTAKDLTAKDKNDISMLKSDINESKIFYFWCGFYSVIFPLATVSFWFIFKFMAIVLGGLSVYYLPKFWKAENEIFNDILKDLGLTKKEFKELKKSGKLKELFKMVEADELKNRANLQEAADNLTSLRDEKERLTNVSSDFDKKEEDIKSKSEGFINTNSKLKTINKSIKSDEQYLGKLIRNMIEKKQITQEEADAYVTELNLSNN